MTACSIKSSMRSGQQPGAAYIVFQRFLRYIRTAVLLHTVSIAGILLFFNLGPHAAGLLLDPHSSLFEFALGFLSIYGLILVLFSQADAKARFQNYKQAKDLLYENGFDERIVRLFSGTRCQREAVRVAAVDLGMSGRLDSYFKAAGFRFYHVMPVFLFRRPQLLLTWKYWQRTLFEATYQSKYFLW